MKIAVIGSGNIATFFAQKFHEQQHQIVQVISKHAIHANELASNFNCAFGTSIQELTKQADIYLLAVKDDVMIDLVGDFDFENKMVIHTAGSITLANLKEVSQNIGSIWCMYSVNKNHLPERKNIPLVINASNTETLKIVELLANCISNAIYTLSDDQKSIAHLAAVFANNFSNHLFTIGSEILNKENIPFEIVLPLIQNTVEKLMYSSPDKLQTGPAIRNDRQTIEKHLRLLEGNESYTKIYTLLTESIMNKYNDEI